MKIFSVCFLLALLIFNLSVHGVRVINFSPEPAVLFVIFADRYSEIVDMLPFSQYNVNGCIELYVKQGSGEFRHFEHINDNSRIMLTYKQLEKDLDLF